MTNFIVNNTSFTINDENIDSLNITSYDKNYNVIFTKENLNEILQSHYNQGDFIICDQYFKNEFTNAHDYIFFIEATENNKTIEYVLQIFDILYTKKFNKLNKLIIIGGGIIQDICGFLAAIYKRGINWIFIPTTMLAMTDSCIGGKVGLNRNSKNMIALFVSPTKIIISDWFLHTLDNDMIISGLGESLKLSLISGKKNYEKFMQLYYEKKYIDIIKQSLIIKKVIIEKDELEKNERRVLNYGHTIGHALEIASDYFIPHGIAVLLGMYYINRLFNIVEFNDVNKIIMEIIPNKYKIKLDKDLIIKQILNDKKNIGLNICFIVLETYGVSIFKFTPIDEVKLKIYNILNDFL
jgi:3-dehydroquinate synthase